MTLAEIPDAKRRQSARVRHAFIGCLDQRGQIIEVGGGATVVFVNNGLGRPFVQNELGSYNAGAISVN